MTPDKDSTDFLVSVVPPSFYFGAEYSGGGEMSGDVRVAF